MPLYCFMVTVLLAPVTLKAEAEVTPEGGFANIIVYFLFFRMRLPFRAYFLAPPLFTVWRLQKDGREHCMFPADKKKKKKPKSVEAFLRADARLSVEVCYVVGTEDAARTAMLCGTIKSATETALRTLSHRVEARVCALPQFDFPCFRILLIGITRFRIAEVIRKRLEERGLFSHGASTRNHYAVHRGGAKEPCGR